MTAANESNLASNAPSHYAKRSRFSRKMVVPLQTAVRSLMRSAEDQPGNVKLIRRLGDLQTLLEDDLAWVEAGLTDATSRGERPGRDAAQHLVSHGGKRVRPMSLLLSAGHDVTAVTGKSTRSRLFEDVLAREPMLRRVEIDLDARGAKTVQADDALTTRLWNCDRLAPESLLFNLASRSFYEKNRFDLVVVSFIPDLSLLHTSDSVLLNVFGLPPNDAIATLERPLVSSHVNPQSL